MKILIVMMLGLGLVACQDNEKTETTPLSSMVEKQAMSTQAVKKDELTPAVVQKNVKEETQAVVETLAEVQAGVNPCSMKEAMPNNPCAVKETTKPVEMVNPCAAKKVMNPCAAKKATATVKHVAVVNPCSTKEAVIEIVKVTTNFTAKCKACHKVNKDAVGPSFKKIQVAYGSSAVLAKVFESGFAVADRKVAASDAKYKKKTGMMTSQYKKLIKKKVEGGKFTYQALADEIFSK